MISPELLIILINLSILSFSYLWFFPRIAGSDALKLAKYDSLSVMVAIGISFFFFYESYVEFDTIFFKLDWFWFSLLTFFIMEIPFALRYFKQNNIYDSMNRDN